MLFNSFDFALFLPFVLIVYWLLRRHLKVQNLFILISSYVFYAWWDWRFLGLIAFSSAIDYWVGLNLPRNQLPKNILLTISLGANLGMLLFFKYANFFIEGFVDGFSILGAQMEVSTLNIILPVGVSFYTFQTLSYTIDIYKDKQAPIGDPIAFFAFVAFFPQLVAGPIERASALLPQFLKKRQFQPESSRDGLRQMLWGLFKKMVIADGCGSFVDPIFLEPSNFQAGTLVIAALLFSVQLYADFSGYTDIAIGLSRLFGFHLNRNFNFPYFSSSLRELWRKWHISLTTWFRDYVYIPLGGSSNSRLRTSINVVAVFTLSGFWHGANWTFITWGLLHAAFYLVPFWFRLNRVYARRGQVGFPLILQRTSKMIQTFLLFSFTLIFFRASSMEVALNFLHTMFTSSIRHPQLPPIALAIFIFVLFFLEWLQRDKEHGLDFTEILIPKWARWTIYYSICAIIIWFGSSEEQFIYFQF